MNSDPENTNQAGQPTELQEPPPTPPEAVAVPDKPKKKSHHKKKEKRHPALDLLEVRDTLGLSEEFWDKAKIAAYETFGQFLDVPMARTLLSVKGFDCLEQVAIALKVGREIAENECFEAEQRLLGAKIIALTTESQVKMSEFLYKIAEKSGKNGEPVKKKNLPPQALAAQVNIYPAGNPMKQAGATLGHKGNCDVVVEPSPVLSLPDKK